jgi:hypothetical protein
MRFSLATLFLVMTAGVLIYDYFSAGRVCESTEVFIPLPSHSLPDVVDATDDLLELWEFPGSKLPEKNELKHYYIGQFPVPVQPQKRGNSKGNAVAPRFGGRVIFYQNYTGFVPLPSEYLGHSCALFPCDTRLVPLSSLAFQVVDISFLALICAICFLIHRIYVYRRPQRQKRLPINHY